jgi:hypothetical protein
MPCTKSTDVTTPNEIPTVRYDVDHLYQAKINTPVTLMEFLFCNIILDYPMPA